MYVILHLTLVHSSTSPLSLMERMPWAAVEVAEAIVSLHLIQHVMFAAVGFTESGEMLEYSFSLAKEAIVDNLVRTADANSKQLTVIMPGFEGMLSSRSGQGCHEFQDVVAFEESITSVPYFWAHESMCN